MDDIYAISGNDLAEQYGKSFIDDLLRFAEGRDRARLVDDFEHWRNGGRSLSPDTKELLWSKVYHASTPPPVDPADIIRIIKEDRAFREDRILRSFGTDARSASTVTRKDKSMSEAEAAAATARKRIDENSTIRITTEEGKNPKRPGSAAYDRFALYRDGMTVKEAKEAGVSATDISYDSAPEHGYISLTPPEPSAEGEEAEAPKKRRSQAAA
jgi:hypothetical protein